MAEQSLGLESVPFFKKPLDASESDRIVGQDDAGNFVYQTFLGNRYTVARDPDQRTTRTKIEEDVIPAVKAYAENPRLPTGEEVVGAGKAIVEGAVETASIPGDLLTGKRSPTDVQMGDAFDIAGGVAVGAGLQTLPDNAVGSMVGAFRRKEKPDTELAFPSPRLEQKTDTSFSYPTQTINFSGPISSYVEAMNIPKKGITANNFLKEIRNNLNVPVRVFPDSFVDSSKRYTREELLDLVEQKEFKVKAQEQEMYQGTQRQNEAGFTYGDEQEYFFMNIAATTGAGKITPRRQHSSRDDIGHVRGSIITPNVNSPYSNSGAITEFNDVTENKPFLLAEEFQSDLYQKGYKKTNPKFMQEAVETYYGGLSKESQKIIADSSLAANKINLPAVNDYGYIRNNTMILTDEAIERTMKDATERGYIGGDTFDSISFSVNRLKGVETDEVFKPAYLDTKRIENTVRMLAEKGVSINLPETEVFKGEMFVPPSVDVETIFKVDPLSLSNSSLIADQSTFLDSNPQVLSRVQSMDPDTAEIFNTTTIGELNAATQEWLESLSTSAQSQGFVPSLIEDAVRNETNAERMGRGDRITADDIGGRTSGDIGDPGTISEVAENLVRKKLGLSLNDESGYPDDINSYFKLVNAYSDLIYQQISFPNDTVNVLGKLSATKKTDDKQIKKLEDYITKTTQGILDYRTKIVDQENEMDKHFEKFVGKLDDEEAAKLTPEQAKALRRSAIDGLREAYKDLKRNTNDFQGLDAVTPPIKQVKSVTDEMLKILIVKAATSGVDKIVIPPTDRIAAIRFRDHRASPEKFTQLYDEGIPASIQELKQNYPEVIVTRDVEMPYDNSMYPPGYNDIPSNQGTVIDLEAFFKKYDVSPDGSVRQFAQGGVAMKDQMEMSFGRAETRDPVSGNNVPPGSLPVEVRDDIPARLSEGEYVVPADVVRYFGVRVFEEMRMEAKRGLQQMDADGRIGGEPMEPQQAELSDDDLNSIIEQAMQEQQPIMANEGTLVDSTSGAYKPPEVIQKYGLGLGSSLFNPNFGKNDFYNIGDYKPSTGDVDTAETIQDQAASTEPVCGINPMTGKQQVYNKDLGKCVDRKTGDDEGPPPGGTTTTTTTTSTSWGIDKEGNQVDFGDPEALEKYIDSLNTPVDLPGTETLRDSAALAGKFIHPIAGLAIGAASLYGKVDATTDIAGLRAGRITAAIYGHDQLVKDIEEKIAGYTGGTGFTRGGKFGDKIKTNDAVGGLFGTGFGFSSKAHGSTNKEIKAFMEMVDNPNTDPKKLEEVRKKLKEKSIAHRKAQRELAKISSDKEKFARLAAERTAAQVAQQQAAARRNPNVIPGNGDEGGSGNLPSEVKSGYVSGNVKGLSNPQREEIDRSSSKIDKEDADSFEDLNTGGLVQKRKKKK